MVVKTASPESDMVSSRSILHVCVQSPSNLSGGMGVSVLGTARAQLAKGDRVSWLTIRLRNDPERRSIEYPEGVLDVEFLNVPDTECVSNHNGGGEVYRFARREAFCRRAIEHINANYSDDWFIQLQGLFFEPLMAAGLRRYSSLSTYHLLWTKRLEALGENGSLLFTIVRQLEILSILASQRIHAISCGMKADMAVLLSSLDDAEMHRELARLAPSYGVNLPTNSSTALHAFEQKTKIILHGVDSVFAQPAVLPTNTKRVGAWGRMTAEKGYEFLLEVARARRDLTFSFWGTLGEGEPKRETYKQKVMGLGQALPNVSLDFKPNGIRGRELLEKIDACEIIVIPSLYEPFGLVVLEAMLRRKPIVVSANAGSIQSLGVGAPGRYPWGYLISPERGSMTNEIAASLDNFFNLSEKEKQGMGEAGGSLAAMFSWQRIADDIETWVCA